MTTQSAVITFSLPEDMYSDFMYIYSGASKDGSYTFDVSTDYQYGTTKFEYDSLDDTTWYKIRFYNSNDNEWGPYSDPVYGGDFDAAAPFLAVSTTTDGANYANTTDLYQYSHLTASDVSQSEVSRALKQARARIDFRTAEMGLSRFDVFDTDTARRKYNATLRLIKEAEINIALSVIYTNLSDDLIIANMRSGTGSVAGNVSIGSTSVSGDSLAERNESTLYLAALAARYAAQGEEILSSLDTNSVRLVAYDITSRSPKFRYPFNGW
jgi:hypothetical protein